MSQYSVKVTTTLDPELFHAWQSLWSRSSFANYINGPQWIKALMETSFTTRIRVVAIYQKMDLVGIVGLTQIKLYGISILTFGPSDFASGDPILTSDLNHKAIMRRIVTTVANMGLTLLNNYPDHNINLLGKYLPDLIILPQTKNYLLPIRRNDDGQIILNNRKKLINEAKRYFDRYHMQVCTVRQLDELLTVFAIDAKSKKNDANYSAFSSKETRHFYQNLAKYFPEGLLVSLLYLDNVPVAYEVGFRVKNVYTGSQIAYDRQYESFTPGKASEVMVIDEIAKLGVTLIDYGSGDSHIKRLICHDYQLLFRAVFGGSLVSRIYLTVVFRLKDRLYEILSRHKTIYGIYKSIRKYII